MFEKDSSLEKAQSAVNEAKRSITLDADSQSPAYSGHSSGQEEVAEHPHVDMMGSMKRDVSMSRMMG